MILGGYRARRLLVAHLQAQVPDALARLEVAGDRPTVEEWLPAWRPAGRVTAWPVVMVSVLRGRHLERLGVTPAGPLDRWQWTTRTFAYVRGDSYDALADGVQLLCAAICETLAAYPRLDERAKVEPGLQVSLSDVERLPRAEGSIAGGFVEATVTIDEVATIPPAGTAKSVALTVGPVEG